MTAEDLASELLDVSMHDDPIGASLLGVAGYDDKLPDMSIEAEEETASKLSSIARRAQSLDSEALSERQLQTLDFVRHTATVLHEAACVPLIEWTIGASFAAPVASVLTMLPRVAVDTDGRKAGYLERLRALPAMLATAARRHSQGVEHRRPPVARLVRAAVEQLDFLIDDQTLGGLKRIDAANGILGHEVDAICEGDVRPALRTYRDELSSLMEAARDDEHCGLDWLPDGRTMYETLSRRHTSTSLTADQLHSIGREVIERVRSEFCDVGSRLWGTSDIGEIFDRLRDDPELRYASSEEMLEVARAAVARAEDSAPKWFGFVPDERCLVEAVTEAEEAGAAPAFYIPGAIDGSRRGTYYLNTSKPEERFRHLAEVVAFHEAVPGHHFQLTIGLQQSDLPLARRIMVDTACAEGWGLYAERLADEMGLYADDLARLGMLSADSWRASRLVVDTGIHHLGWGREQAVGWMREHTPLAEVELQSEIDRYITYPAQALSYMVGRMEITRLREESSRKLAGNFDLRAFHDLVLRVGALPLSALSGAVERWAQGRGPEVAPATGAHEPI